MSSSKITVQTSLINWPASHATDTGLGESHRCLPSGNFCRECSNSSPALIRSSAEFLCKSLMDKSFCILLHDFAAPFQPHARRNSELLPFNPNLGLTLAKLYLPQHCARPQGINLFTAHTVVSHLFSRYIHCRFGLCPSRSAQVPRSASALRAPTGLGGPAYPLWSSPNSPTVQDILSTPGAMNHCPRKASIQLSSVLSCHGPC